MKPTAIWKVTTVQVKLFFVICVWLIGTTAIAATDNVSEEQIPDIAFLEFLGSFEDPDGKWIDPMEIDSMINEEKTAISSATIKEDSNDE